jgi:hypothetical protein
VSWLIVRCLPSICRGGGGVVKNYENHSHDNSSSGPDSHPGPSEYKAAPVVYHLIGSTTRELDFREVKLVS